jgi:hypothetical protein
MRKYDRMVADYREFTHEIILRLDRHIARLDRTIAEQREQLAEMRRENREYFEALHARTDEIIEENRAQRQALLRILDRLDNGGAAPA